MSSVSLTPAPPSVPSDSLARQVQLTITLRGLPFSSVVSALAGVSSGATGRRNLCQWLSAVDTGAQVSDEIRDHFEKAAVRWLREHGQRPGEFRDAAAPRTSVQVRLEVLRRGDAMASHFEGTRSFTDAAYSASELLSYAAMRGTKGAQEISAVSRAAAASRDARVCALDARRPRRSGQFSRAKTRISAGSSSASVLVSSAKRARGAGDDDASHAPVVPSGTAATFAPHGHVARDADFPDTVISHAALNLISEAIAKGASDAVSAYVFSRMGRGSGKDGHLTVSSKRSLASSSGGGGYGPLRGPAFSTPQVLMGRASASPLVPRPLPFFDLFSLRSPYSSVLPSWVAPRPLARGARSLPPPDSPGARVRAPLWLPIFCVGPGSHEDAFLFDACDVGAHGTRASSALVTACADIARKAGMGDGAAAGLANAAVSQATAWIVNFTPRLAESLAQTTAAAAAAVSNALALNFEKGDDACVIPLPISLLALLDMPDGGDKASGGTPQALMTPAEYLGAAGVGSSGEARRSPWWPQCAPVALVGAINAPLLWDIRKHPDIEYMRLAEPRYVADMLTPLLSSPAVAAGVAVALSGRAPAALNVAHARWPTPAPRVGLPIDVRIGHARFRGIFPVDLCEALRGEVSADADKRLPWPLATAKSLGKSHGFDGAMLQGVALALATALCDALIVTTQEDTQALEALRAAAVSGPELSFADKKTRSGASATTSDSAVISAPLLRELLQSVDPHVFDAAVASCAAALAREPDKDDDAAGRVRLKANMLATPAIIDSTSFTVS